ncbi:RNA polymerase sigma-70 factor [Paraflavitalea sp. CAU 1676]|uniref:RNA polymerase sigma-70 factor n=1 Tax=Paraflavitalea sp. CAU 1676 TaxID=3032598 RepID=UPI0023DAE2A3|nr:RNA polymerase sigma-70 factor [Paraflavitalea sp. CAU 1676]MDF2192598.1 RNA polymerase sigma-70 factor [Paraflavitalea sp. CAU 1676]
MISGEINNDVQLAAAFRDDNEKTALPALNALWKNNYKALVFYANQLIKNDLLSEDIVSEVFTKLWALRKNFDNTPSIRAFLYVSVRNACYDHLRSEDIHNRIHKEILYTTDYVAEVNRDDYDMMYAEYIQQLYVQVKELPERCGEVFKLFFFQQLTTREIALALNISEQTVRNQKTKAVGILKAALLKKDLLPVSFVLHVFAILLAGDE